MAYCLPKRTELVIVDEVSQICSFGERENKEIDPEKSQDPILLAQGLCKTKRNQSCHTKAAGGMRRMIISEMFDTT